MTVNRIYGAVVGVCLLLVGVLFPWKAVAEEITLTPLIDVTGGYDDNVYYNRYFKEADYVATARPGVIFDYDSELFNVKSRGSVEFLQYRYNKSLNRENYYAFFDGGVNLTERWNLKGNFSYVNDTTLDSQLQETGIVSFRTDRKRYNGGGEVSYRLTERSNTGLGYNHQSTRYGSRLYENFDYDYLRLFWDQTFNGGLDRFTVQPYYGYWSSDVSDVNNYGLSFGYSHAFSETFYAEVFAGPRYTQTERKYNVTSFQFDPATGTFRLVLNEMKATDSNWGGTGSLQLTKNWTRSNITAGYSHDLTYSSNVGDDAEPINVDRFYVTASHRIYSRFQVAFSGSFYISESASTFGNRDNRYLQVTPSVNYDITRNYALKLVYNYSRDLDKRIDTDPGNDRNRVWITFTGRFPMKW